MRRAMMFCFILLCGASVGFAQEDGWPQIALSPLVGGLSAPTYATDAGDGSGRLFIVEQRGTIRIFRDGALLPTFFLNILPQVLSGGERGLLSMAFPPSFSQGGNWFYVYYTARQSPVGVGALTISRFYVSAEDPDVADPASEEILMTIRHDQFSNHNGGQLQFGPGDGYLYIGTGDGGGGGDPFRSGQNLSVLLGKMLRIDVESGVEYAIPADNPFVGVEGAREEIWAYGLRNPWRFSFDSVNWDLYTADVGQNAREEVDFQPWDSLGGENYGWCIWEGSLRYTPCAGEADNPVFPVAEYPHAGGDCSITGGFVYRGEDFPGMYGIYFYGDYCTGRTWGLRHNGEEWETRLLLGPSFIRMTSFGKDENGNLLLAHQGGTIYMVTEVAKSCSGELPE